MHTSLERTGWLALLACTAATLIACGGSPGGDIGGGGSPDPSGPGGSSSSTSGEAPSASSGSGTPQPAPSSSGDPTSGSASSQPAPEPPPGEALPKTFAYRSLDTSVYPNAVCNDGSPAGYYLEAGTDASTWVVMLEGGSWCGSDAECQGRAPALSSSKGIAKTIAPTGILSGDAKQNPHFASANRIDVPYCTSDVFSGTTGPTGGKTNFSFQGKAVLAAIVDDLFKHYGFGATGQRALLAGVSAGGVSVLTNVGRFAAAVPNVKVSGLVDAGFLPDVAPLAGPSIVTQFHDAIAYWKGEPDAACASKYGSAPEKCYLGQYAQPELAVPIFFGQSLEDPHGPMHVGGFTLSESPTPAQKDWVDQVYTPAVTSLMRAMPEWVGSFSPCKVIHTMADTSSWSSLTVAGSVYDDAVWTWWSGASMRVLPATCSLN
jgi:hypothetical protein